MAEFNRRVFLQRAMQLGAATTLGSSMAGILFSACKKEQPEVPINNSGTREDLSCDISELTPEEIAIREGFQYIDHTTIQNQTCDNCHLYVAAEGCGTCSLFPGLVHPNGWCVQWVILS